MVKSVMEKYQDVLIQKNEGAQLAQTVNQMHKLLSSACSGGNEQIAKQASEFLTWLLFGNYTDDYLTLMYRQQLLIDNEKIQNAVNEINKYAKESVQLTELGRQYQITGDKNLMSEIGRISQQRGINTEQYLVEIINNFIKEDSLKIKQSGKDQMTVWFNSWLKDAMQNVTDQIDEDLSSLVKHNKKLRFAYKNVKLDTTSDNPNAIIDFAVTDPNLSNNLQAVYSVLSSASIKSKNSLSRIDLEEVTIIKAYSAFINYARKKRMPQSQIKNLFMKYYKNEELKDDPYITLHLNHLISTYALTGLGTTLESDLKSILDGAKYLVAIDNTNKKVIIHSTNKIINEIILKNTYNKGIVTNINLNLNRI